jgi:hypothetical protein
MPREKHIGTPAEVQAKKDLLMNKGIRPNAEAIARIGVDGDIAVLVVNPMGGTKRLAQALGWTPKRPVLRLARSRMEALANADAVTASWVRRPRPDTLRIFVLMEHGTLLVNFEPNRGYYIEPGSSEIELERNAN